MYVLKSQPEDFVVDEQLSFEPGKEGEYAIYKLEKRDLTSFEAFKRAAQVLGVSQKAIGYAGLKDRHAITSQFISILKKNNLLEEYTFENGKLTLVGYSSEKLFIGNLAHNRFTIVIRNIDKIPKKLDSMINYFGEQRFSTHNVAIGRALVKGNFDEAVTLVKESESISYEVKNSVSFLQKQGKRILTFYVQAYQSFLWNECVAQYTKNGVKEKQFPLLGFGIDIPNDMQDIVDSVLEDEGITLRNFILRSLPDISLEGDMRNIFVPVADLAIGDLEDDDAYEGRKKCSVSFILSKGSYATVCIKQMMD